MASGSRVQEGKGRGKLSSSTEAQVQCAILNVAGTDTPVLIQGESGVGKRTIAAQIHVQSHRSRSMYKEMKCATIGEREVRTALSYKGTVYLEEIGELNLDMQKMLLENYFHAEKPATARFLFGTSRDLREDVSSWRMREDFYYCISAITLLIPPLRCRKAEILRTAEDLLTQYAHQFDRPKPVLRAEILDFLMKHSWPGNWSELQTAIKTIVAIGEQSISLVALKAAVPAGKYIAHRKPMSLKEATRAASIQIERQLISEALVLNGGNRKRAAGELGISYKALLYKF